MPITTTSNPKLIPRRPRLSNSLPEPLVFAPVGDTVVVKGPDEGVGAIELDRVDDDVDVAASGAFLTFPTDEHGDSMADSGFDSTSHAEYNDRLAGLKYSRQDPKYPSYTAGANTTVLACVE